MEDDFEYKLNDPGDSIEKEKTNSKNKKIIIALISIIIILILIIIIGIILYFTSGKKKENGEKEKDYVQEQDFLEAYVYANISTSENNMIRNSFKKGGENYIPEIGNLNNGNDYKENERDNFDLCIPKNLLQNKTNYKTINLNIHGGGWMGGNKMNVLDGCNNGIYKNNMIAAMSYTLLNGNYTEYNIFRILDEITAVLRTLKRFLINKGFDGNKLELIIQGGSAGAHLSLLYSYMIKNPPIPIKFILNLVGPITVDPADFLATLNGSEPLEDIGPEEIKKAKKEGRIIPMNGTETGVNTDNLYLIAYMNGWLGRPIFKDFDKIFINITRKEINKSSEIYKELLKNTSYAYPYKYVTKESIPTICIYGGKDGDVGVVQYAKLKEAFLNNSNDNISLVYFKYGKHDAFYNCTGEYGKYMMEKYEEEIKKYMKKYLDSYNKNN